MEERARLAEFLFYVVVISFVAMPNVMAKPRVPHNQSTTPEMTSIVKPTRSVHLLSLSSSSHHISEVSPSASSNSQSTLPSIHVNHLTPTTPIHFMSLKFSVSPSHGASEALNGIQEDSSSIVGGFPFGLTITSTSHVNWPKSRSVHWTTKSPSYGRSDKEEDNKIMLMVLGIAGGIGIIVVLLLLIFGVFMKGKCKSRSTLEPISTWVTTETGADELLGSRESIELGPAKRRYGRGVTNDGLDSDDDGRGAASQLHASASDNKRVSTFIPAAGPPVDQAVTANRESIVLQDAPQSPSGAQVTSLPGLNQEIKKRVNIRLLQNWLDEYSNSNSVEYNELKCNVETEVTSLYLNAQGLKSVDVTRLRNGSVIAELLLRFFAVISFDPLSPLNAAVKRGKCGRLKLDKDFDLEIQHGSPSAKASGKMSHSPKKAKKRHSTAATEAANHTGQARYEPVRLKFHSDGTRPALHSVENVYSDPYNITVSVSSQGTASQPAAADEHIYAEPRDVVETKHQQNSPKSNDPAAKKKKKASRIVQHVASATFVPLDSREVQLVIGEPVEIIARDASGWVKVLKKNNELGWVPASFLQQVTPKHLQSTLETVKALHYLDQVLLAYDTSSGDSSSDASKGGSLDDDAYLAPVRRKIQEADDLNDARLATKHRIGSSMPSVVELTQGDRYEALFDYPASDDGELSLTAGDTVDIIQISETGWWRGQCRDMNGWFPASYVQALQQGSIAQRKSVKLTRSLSDGAERDGSARVSDPRSPEYMELVKTFVPPRKYSGLYIDLIKTSRERTPMSPDGERDIARQFSHQSIAELDERESPDDQLNGDVNSDATKTDDEANSIGKDQPSQSTVPTSSGPSKPDRVAPKPLPRKITAPPEPTEPPPRLMGRRPLSVPGSHGDPPKRPVPPPPSRHHVRNKISAKERAQNARIKAKEIVREVVADREVIRLDNHAVTKTTSDERRLQAPTTPGRGLSRSLDEINKPWDGDQRHGDHAVTRKRPLSLIGQGSPPRKPLPPLDRQEVPEVPTRNRKAINIDLLKAQLGENIVNRVGQERRSRSNRPNSTPNINFDQLRRVSDRNAALSSWARGSHDLHGGISPVKEADSPDGTLTEMTLKQMPLRRHVSRSMSDASPLSSPIGDPTLAELSPFGGYVIEENDTKSTVDQDRTNDSPSQPVRTESPSVAPRNRMILKGRRASAGDVLSSTQRQAPQTPPNSPKPVIAPRPKSKDEHSRVAGKQHATSRVAVTPKPLESPPDQAVARKPVPVPRKASAQ